MSKLLPVRMNEQLFYEFKEIKELGLKPSTFLKALAKLSVDIIRHSDEHGLILQDNTGLFLNICKILLPVAVTSMHEDSYKEYYNMLRDTIARKLKEQNDNLIDFDNE